ncbi:hypothetical protein NKH74_10730 [Mesorhizobium sp. M0933]|uniref:hypothetical protein n=1 Tax=Mesorhizobium sp. M0933 TaxID=2957030 RepID=UPI003335A43C
MTERANPPEGARSSGAFRPDDDAPDFEFSGQRKQPLRVDSQRLFWPNNRKDQEAAFWTWHSVAMQICDGERYDFRILAILHKLIYWQDGTIRATNEEFAARAGRCSERTITRDISKVVGIGLFRRAMRYDPTTGKTQRTITLSYPKQTSGVVLPDDEDE